MDHHIAIQKLSEQMGLTSRTLRHWEAEGLIVSRRDQDSGWRCYDSRNVFFIRLIALLRGFDISLKDIKKILDSGRCETLEGVIRQYLVSLDQAKQAFDSARIRLQALLISLEDLTDLDLTVSNLEQILKRLSDNSDIEHEKEINAMQHENMDFSNIRFVTLPAMRAAYYIAVSTSPEEDALKAVTDWVKAQHLEGTARLLGGDMPPLPSADGKPYGYGVLATIPQGVTVTAPMKEMTVPGGLYAVMESSDDIGGSWKRLMQALQGHEEYTPDHTRQCYEEHIRNDAPEGSGRDYFLRLMEPVKRK